MGYYSDVRISTTKEGFEHVKEVLSDFLETTIVVDVDDENGVVFGWNCLKWYPEFDEVKAVESALHEVEERGIPYEYARLGEENEYELFQTGNYEKLHYRLEQVSHIGYWW